MTQPETATNPAPDINAAKTSLMKGAIWVSISALILSAFICIYWVLTGEDGNIIAQAFLTVLLLTGFSLVVLTEVKYADFKPQWYVIASLGAWIALLILGLVKIWWNYEDNAVNDYSWWAEINSSAGVVARFFLFGIVVGLVRLALVFIRSIITTAFKNFTIFNKIAAAVSVTSIAITTLLLSLPFVVEDWFDGNYWRWTVAVAILATTGSLIIPLVNSLTRPKNEVPQTIQTPQGYYDPSQTPQGYYDPSQTPQGYYDPNQVPQGYYAPQAPMPEYYTQPAPQGYYDPQQPPQGYYDPNQVPQGYYAPQQAPQNIDPYYAAQAQQENTVNQTPPAPPQYHQNPEQGTAQKSGTGYQNPTEK